LLSKMVDAPGEQALVAKFLRESLQLQIIVIE
jgi:hypothetical protein